MSSPYEQLLNTRATPTTPARRRPSPPAQLGPLPPVSVTVRFDEALRVYDLRRDSPRNLHRIVRDLGALPTNAAELHQLVTHALLPFSEQARPYNLLPGATPQEIADVLLATVQQSLSKIPIAHRQAAAQLMQPALDWLSKEVSLNKLLCFPLATLRKTQRLLHAANNEELAMIGLHEESSPRERAMISFARLDTLLSQFPGKTVGQRGISAKFKHMGVDLPPPLRRSLERIMVGMILSVRHRLFHGYHHFTAEQLTLAEHLSERIQFYLMHPSDRNSAENLVNFRQLMTTSSDYSPAPYQGGTQASERSGQHQLGEAAQLRIKKGDGRDRRIDGFLNLHRGILSLRNFLATSSHLVAPFHLPLLTEILKLSNGLLTSLSQHPATASTDCPSKPSTQAGASLTRFKQFELILEKALTALGRPELTHKTHTAQLQALYRDTKLRHRMLADLGLTEPQLKASISLLQFYTTIGVKLADHDSLFRGSTLGVLAEKFCVDFAARLFAPISGNKELPYALNNEDLIDAHPYLAAHYKDSHQETTSANDMFKLQVAFERWLGTPDPRQSLRGAIGTWKVNDLIIERYQSLLASTNDLPNLLGADIPAHVIEVALASVVLGLTERSPRTETSKAQGNRVAYENKFGKLLRDPRNASWRGNRTWGDTQREQAAVGSQISITE